MVKEIVAIDSKVYLLHDESERRISVKFGLEDLGKPVVFTSLWTIFKSFQKAF
jgi:hypothetical protein